MKRVTIPAALPLGLLVLLSGLSLYGVASHPVLVSSGLGGLLIIGAITTGTISFVAGLVSLENEDRVRVPLPYPDRSRNLDQRLMKVSVMKREVMKNIERLPEGNAYKSTLKVRYDELGAAEEVLKVELTAKELISLDKRAAKLVRKELG